MHSGLYKLLDCNEILCILKLHSMNLYFVNCVIVEGVVKLQSGSICILRMIIFLLLILVGEYMMQLGW